MTILADDIACGSQAIAVEYTGGITAIGQDHTSGSIPRFHVHGVIFEEGTQIRIKLPGVLPGWRH